MLMMHNRDMRAALTTGREMLKAMIVYPLFFVVACVSFLGDGDKKAAQQRQEAGSVFNRAVTLRDVVQLTYALAVGYVVNLLFGRMRAWSAHNAWAEGAAGLLLWFFIVLVLLAIGEWMYPGHVQPERRFKAHPYFKAWRQLKWRQRIWDAIHFTFYITLLLYGLRLICTLLCRNPPSQLTFWHLIVFCSLAYGLRICAEVWLKTFRCPRCHHKFFDPRKHASFAGLPNYLCRHCSLSVWSYDADPPRLDRHRTG